MGDIARGIMTARKMILLTLAFLLPCGFVIFLMRCVLRSSFGERFRKGATTTRKLAFLASAVLSVAGLTTGCGRGSQTTQQALAPRWVSLTIPEQWARVDICGRSLEICESRGTEGNARRYRKFRCGASTS